MRVFEKLLLAVVFVGLIVSLVFGPVVDQFAMTHLALGASFIVILAAVFLAHAVKERVRWQMVPAYFAVAFLGVLFLLSAIRLPALNSWIAGLGVASLVCSLLFQSLLPMFRFAPLTGRHLVGTTIVHVMDPSRQDASPSGKREFMVQLWYPAMPSKQPYATYRRPAETTRVSSYQGVLKTASRLDAPLAQAEERCPILLFNPAWNGRRTQNTFLVEELASHGFVVAAIDHTYNSEPVAFPDGRVVMANHIRAMEDVSTTTADEIQRIGNDEVARQVLDGRFVLDQMEVWNNEEGSKWHQRLATDCAGALGHSLGGATAIESWATDPRIHAAMNMDGWTFGDQAATGHRHKFPSARETAKPLLFIYEGNYRPFPTPVESAASNKCDTEKEVDAWDAAHVRDLLEYHGGYWFKLQGANHMNFTDRTITSPLRRLAGGGAIDARLAHRILRAYAVAFFSQALRGEDSPLLVSLPSPYAEVVGSANP